MSVPFARGVQIANDNAPSPDPLGVNEPLVILATFPDAILLTVESDDAFAADWRRLYLLHQRASAERAAHDLAGRHGLTLRNDDCRHVRVTRG